MSFRVKLANTDLMDMVNDVNKKQKTHEEKLARKPTLSEETGEAKLKDVF